MKKKYIVKTIVFLLIFILLFYGISNIFRAKWIDGTRISFVMEDMYKQEKDSVDVCLMGNSQTAYGLQAMRMLDKYGISAYGCATALQPMACTYFLLKEFDKRQSLSVAVLDVSALYEPIEEARYRQTLDWVPLSVDKINFIREMCREDEDAGRFWSYIFPMIQYHSRWDELEEQDFKYESMRTSVFKGSTSRSKVTGDIEEESLFVDNEPINEYDTMLDDQVKYFRMIVEYCQENNIQLLLVKTPKTSWSNTRMQGTQKLADEYGLDYLDFNQKELFEETGIDLKRDFEDIDHLNLRGAEKLTDYVSEYLCSKYDFEDGKERAGYDALKDAYEDDREDRYLQTSRNSLENLERMNSERYEVFLQISGNINRQWNPELQEALEKLGAEVDLQTIGNQNYVAHLSNGEKMYEEVSEEPISYKGKAKNGITVKIKADQTVTDKAPSMKIGDEKIIYKDRGLDITVYDTENKRVVRNLHYE